MTASRRSTAAYHLLVATALGALVLSGCTDDEPTPTEPMAPAVSSNVEEDPPRPETVPSPPLDDAPAVVEPARQIPEPEPVEDEPVHAGTIRPGVGPEDCANANGDPGMTQAEWVEFCYVEEEVPTTAGDEAHLDGDDGYQPGGDAGELVIPEGDCIGYGCDPEQDAELLEDEAAANDGL